MAEPSRQGHPGDSSWIAHCRDCLLVNCAMCITDTSNGYTSRYAMAVGYGASRELAELIVQDY
jgi:hypothetical protein